MTRLCPTSWTGSMHRNTRPRHRGSADEPGRWGSFSPAEAGPVVSHEEGDVQLLLIDLKGNCISNFRPDMLTKNTSCFERSPEKLGCQARLCRKTTGARLLGRCPMRSVYVPLPATGSRASISTGFAYNHRFGVFLASTPNSWGVRFLCSSLEAERLLQLQELQSKGHLCDLGRAGGRTWTPSWSKMSNTEAMLQFGARLEVWLQRNSLVLSLFLCDQL